MKNEETKEIQALRKYRDKHELSYDLLAKELDVHISSVSRWLHFGIRPSPIKKRLIIAFLKKKGMWEKEKEKF